MDLIKKKLELLEKIYHNPQSPAGFAGVQTLYKEAKKQDPSITINDVKYYLKGTELILCIDHDAPNLREQRPFHPVFSPISKWT